MRTLSSIAKAGSTIQRWLLGEDENLARPGYGHSVQEEPPSAEREDSPEERISRFIEELKASSQEWFGRVRMINLDSVRERMGQRWPKLRARVEILAERMIQDEIAGHDRYLNAGNAEFLVFFADATLDESRIRCFAIVEAIHEKLFGLSESASEPGRRVAECHVIHRDEVALAWEKTDSSDRRNPDHQTLARASRESFRHDAEILDGPDIIESTQRVIDSIISCGAESQSISELAPLLLRLKSLARSLKILEPALAAAGKSPSPQSGQLGTAQVGGVEAADHRLANAAPLGTAWEDIAELTSVLDVSSDHSHTDLLAALARLQRARLERAANESSGRNPIAVRFNPMKCDTGQFTYTPIYRSVFQGERIHQGIYRVECGREKNVKADIHDGFEHPRQELMALERSALQHAIEYLLDRKVSAQFMLMAAVHVETLRSPNAQMRYSMILRSAQLRAKRRLLIGVTGYSDRDDTIGIRRAIDEFRIHSQGVFVSVSHKSVGNLEKIAIECKKSGVHAWGMDVSGFNGQHAAIFSAIARLSSLGTQYSIPTFVDGIGDVAVLGKAIASGARYVCAPPLRPSLKMPDDAESASFEDLFSAV